MVSVREIGRQATVDGGRRAVLEVDLAGPSAGRAPLCTTSTRSSPPGAPAIAFVIASIVAAGGRFRRPSAST